MARRLQQFQRAPEGVNLLLFTAWEHGARHIILRPEGDGTEIRFLGPDGTEHAERLSLSYANTVEGLRNMSARHGRVLVNIGGQRWHLETVASESNPQEQLFLHMRAD